MDILMTVLKKCPEQSVESIDSTREYRYVQQFHMQARWIRQGYTTYQYLLFLEVNMSRVYYLTTQQGYREEVGQG